MKMCNGYTFLTTKKLEQLTKDAQRYNTLKQITLSGSLGIGDGSWISGYDFQDNTIDQVLDYINSTEESVGETNDCN